jgi:hypothetical protein
MKTNLKFLLVVLLSVVLSKASFSQKFYVQAGGGYGFALNAQSIDFLNFYNVTEGYYAATFEQQFVSLGTGWAPGLSAGFMMTKNIGIELGASFLSGNSYEATEKMVDWSTTYMLESKMNRFTSSIVLSTDKNPVNFYAKFGLMLAKGFIMYDITNVENDFDYNIQYKFFDGYSVGIQSVIGMEYIIKDRFAFFGDLVITNMNYSPKKGEVIVAKFNGIDRLHLLDTRYKEIEFVESYMHYYEEEPYKHAPRKELKQNLPFGSWGFNTGFRFKF